jgi:hypothetical protein
MEIEMDNHAHASHMSHGGESLNRITAMATAH